MAKVDPGLKFLAQRGEELSPDLADEVAFAVEVDAGGAPAVSVLVQFEDDLSALEEAGFRTRSVAGDVATGEVQLGRIDELAQHPSVTRMEASRVLGRELDLALPESRADAVHTGPPGHRGSGVLVGIIDSGIDYTHQAFRRTDGTSRVLAIWDQGLVAQGGEASPTGFTYGVEYQKVAIDNALGAADPFAVVRHRDLQIPGDGFHGTHVAGIAAGDGSVAGQGQPAFTFVGVAPEADIVVVANTRGRAAGERGLGDSADTLDAIRYIFDFAASLGRPVVINQSQGDNVGPHDGTSLLERGIDNLLGGPGRAMVKSAGNEGATGRHASGTVTAGGLQSVAFTVPAGQGGAVTVDIWYRGPDRIEFTVTPPGGTPSGAVVPGSTTTPPIALPNGNEVFVDSDLNDPGNGDNRIFAVISRGGVGAVQAGTWSFGLRGTTVNLGQWDAWIQRNAAARFLPPLVNPARTISVPGTGVEIITAASYVTRGSGVGTISSFSSLGPTRDGRQAPTVAAPGQVLMAPQPSSTGDTYGLMQGTSMAAPMVTGTVALLLQKNVTLTQAQIRDCLIRGARSDAFTGATPNNAWGAGKLDAQASFQCVLGPVRTLRPPCPPPLTVRPPCIPATIRPPCIPVTLGPPCIPVTLGPPCIPVTLGPPCPPRTLGPPCPPRTVGPPCIPAAPGPGVGTTAQPGRPGGPEASGGWPPIEPEPAGDWSSWADPYGQGGGWPSTESWTGSPAGWHSAGRAWSTAGTEDADESWAMGAGLSFEAGAGSGAPEDDGVTSHWYGNPGY
ncbi:S8 family serine peptidase [Geodermatophilus sp. SYSU D00691]